MVKFLFRVNKVLQFLCFMLLLCLSLNKGFAQIPNNGFENWSSPNGYLIPDSWGNLNVITNSSGIYTATRVNPGMVGAYFMDLTSRNVPGRGIVPGIITSGPIDTVTYKPISGFAYTGRPDALKGKWQYMGFGSDQGFIEIIFTKWNTGTNSRDTIGYVNQILSGMEMSWTNMYIPISYSATGTPDTCVIVISSSGVNPEEESFIYLDELFFDGFVGTEPIILEEKLNVYPNPTTDIINVEFENSTGNPYNIIVENISGQIIKHIHIHNANIGMNSYDFPTFDIANGIYFLKVQINGKCLNQKIKINR